VKAFDSDGVQNDFASVGIAFKGATAVVTSSLDRSTTGDDSAIFWEVTSSDGGKTWSAGTKVPPDKGETSPFGVSMAANASEVLLTYVPNSGNGSATCGKPKLAESSDLTTWKTCSPEGGNTPSVASGFHPGAAAGPDGSLYVGFNNSDPAGVPAGVLLWTKPA
jgi:hypothetical protein